MKNGCKTFYTITHCKIMYTNDIIYSSVFGSCQKQTYG